jgi:cell wall-associated NlpC family hydrolase
MTPEQTTAVITEATTWLNTPYHPSGRIKGVGVDCAMLLLETYSRAGLIEAFDPGAYPDQFGLHRSEEQFMAFVTRYATEIEAPVPGGCVLFRFGRCYSHGGIMVTDTRLIHAVKREGRVAYADLTDADLHEPNGADRSPRFFTIET